MAGNTNLDLAEYNAFGPWAYEISDKYPLPRLFAPYFTADDTQEHCHCPESAFSF